jgi:UPF0271 protein
VFSNLDAGELDNETEELWSLFDLLSCACGGHAGDERSMARVADFCLRSQSVQLGAHPAYPDREHFGRISIAIEPDDLARSIADQCAALANVAGPDAVRAIKPHGALYHDAAKRSAIADAVLRGAAILGDVLVIGPPHGALRDAAIARKLRYAREGFADRRMRPDGSLVPRTEPNALITDPSEAARQASQLAASGDVDTICMHGDTPGALDIARAVHAALRK